MWKLSNHGQITKWESDGNITKWGSDGVITNFFWKNMKFF